MIAACGKRLIVKEKIQEKDPKSLLIIPQKKDQIFAKIIAFGKEVDMPLQIGDFVIIFNDSGVPFEVEGKEYISILENQVLALWKEECDG